MNSKISKGLFLNKLEDTSCEVLKLQSQKARDQITGKFVVEMAQGIESLMLINNFFVCQSSMMDTLLQKDSFV